MKAKILPLSGKYYGTEISIIDEKNNEYTINLWNCGNYEPSDRELGEKCTIEQWRNNDILPVKNGWTGGIGIPAKEYVEICDSHFESRNTYNLALEIIKRLNT